MAGSTFSSNLSNNDIGSEVDLEEFNNIHIHNEKKFKKRIFGLRSKVALKEAIGCMILSVLVLFVPFGDINLNVLILAPVIYVMVCFNVSSITNIVNGAVICYGLGVGSVYLAILIQIIKNEDHFWVSYILNFFFCFILYSVMPGKRWINLFACKMIIINIITTIYFNYGQDRYEALGQFLVIFLLMFAVILICGVFLFPWLATRLFLKKTIKTLNSSKKFFSAVGYQMEAKLDQQEILNENDSKRKNKRKSAPVDGVSTSKPVIGGMRKNKSFIHPIYYLDMYNDNENLEKEVEQNQIEMNSLKNSNINIQVDDFKKKKRNSQHPFKASTIRIPTNQEVKAMESKFTTQIYRLTTLLNECRMERWNAIQISNYEQILSQLSLSQKQLISLKQAVDEGFSPSARHNIIIPMIPFIDSIIEEVSLQITLFIDILSSDEIYDFEKDGEINLKQIAENPENNYDSNSIVFKRIVLKMSFNETFQLVDRAKEFYKFLVKDFQNQYSETSAMTEREVIKLHYFIIGIFEFAAYQQKIQECVFKIKKHQRSEYVVTEILKYGIWYLITALPLHLFKRLNQIIALIKTYTKEQREAQSEAKDGFTGFFKKIYKFLVNWCYVTFFAGGRWHFPLQVSIGFVSTNIIFHYFDLRSYNQFVVHGLWTCITTIIVFQPSLGSTLTRSIHRIMGTTAGGFLGFLVSWLTSIVGDPWREIILLVFTFIWVFIVSHIQQDMRYSYAGSVSGLTWIMISYGQYLSQDYTVMYAVLRLLFIVMGIIWVLIISLIIFPFFTYKDTRGKIFKNVNSITLTFIKTLENNLPIFQKDGVDMINNGDIVIDIPLNNSSPGTNSPLSDINTSKSIPKPMNKNAITALREIRVVNSQIFMSLVDVKSEFFLKPKKFTKYMQIYADLINLNTRLVVSETLFTYDFSPSCIIELRPSFQVIEDLTLDLKKLNEDFNLLIQNKPLIHHYKASDLYNFSTQLEAKVHEIRGSLLSRKILYSFYPDMIQFGAAIYSIHDFIKYQVMLYNHLLEIKKERN